MAVRKRQHLFPLQQKHPIKNSTPIISLMFPLGHDFLRTKVRAAIYIHIVVFPCTDVDFARACFIYSWHTQEGVFMQRMLH
jgi:hypothetical protein